MEENAKGGGEPPSFAAPPDEEVWSMADLTLSRPRSGVARWPRLLGVWGALLLALGAVFMLSLMLGSVRIPLDDVARVLMGGEAHRASWTNIIWLFRVPKAITAVLAGAALAAAGLQLQTLFRNPLADPYILGVSSGASLGVAVVILGTGASGGLLLSQGLGVFGELTLAVAASLGALLVLGVVLVLMRWTRNILALLILGLMLGYLTSALVSLLVYTARPERIQAFSLWSAGSFAGVTWSQLGAFAPVVLVALGVALILPKTLNALLLGEAYARSMGVNVKLARIGVIVSASLLAGATTAFCGPVGFIGVAVPHVTRAILGTSDHRQIVPASLVFGALLALIADLIAQMPGSQAVLPLNTVTALFGVPVVAWVLLRSRSPIA